MEKPDAAKRTSSSNAKDVARFPPDCGARGEELHLSRALAEERTRLQSPTDPATGKRLRTRDIRIGGILSAQTSNLAAFGVGITLYFKLFRFMVLAFTFLTLLGVPRCVARAVERAGPFCPADPRPPQSDVFLRGRRLQ